MRRSFAAAVMTIAGLACGGGDDDPGGPTTIRVEGQVISARSRAPLEGATVSLGNPIGGDFVTTTTDADGRFAASVQYYLCGGVWIWVDQPGYVQPLPPPDVCPGPPRLVEMHPDPVSSVVSPQDPVVAVGGTVDFQVQVTFADGTVEENGSAYWQIGADLDIPDPTVCGSVPDGAPAQSATYTAPSVPPPGECGGSAGQVAVVAAPEAVVGGSLEASDTVVVTVTP